MPKSRSASHRRRAADVASPPRPEDVRRVLGDLADDQVCRVIETGATIDELQQAAAALNGELPGHIGRPIEGAAARVYDLLVVAEDDDPRRGARGGPPEV